MKVQTTWTPIKYSACPPPTNPLLNGLLEISAAASSGHNIPVAIEPKPMDSKCGLQSKVCPSITIPNPQVCPLLKIRENT